ncbi:GNAT family N-acetyltransferase [Hanstruepera flava]|uniref:GNAT family N-acetyltransferase n=1 Tax=Hanstruepera flava TaxID=2930218 RepID=UPI002028A3B5|nr:GNAT family N-acetyltransferase [Hanstruepera flava]
MRNIEFKLINPIDYKNDLLQLVHQLNPNKDISFLNDTLIEMVKLPNYTCFAIFSDNELLGVSSGWTTIRIYRGKHLELDNVIIDSKIQSKGLGNYLISQIKEWALKNEYTCIGLNTYVSNSRSHKFYYKEGFSILGFHFEHKF